MPQQRSFVDVQPAGMLSYFASSSAPAGWLKCNGAAVSRTTYSDLFAVMGTLWGGGDGSTTFNLPDMRGEFLRGWDDGRGVNSGRLFGYWEDYDWKGFYSANVGQGTYSYNHGEVYQGKNTSSYGGGAGTFVGGWAAPSASLGFKWDTSEMRPRNRALLVCVKY